MIDSSNFDCLIFDCDGVILNSNLLKSKAFSEALPGEHPELVKSFVEYHKQHGGVSRYEKFKYFFTVFQNCPDAENKINEALIRFSWIVKKGMLACDFVPGIYEFLKRHSASGVSMFVVSGSDEKELQEVFVKRGIMKYFKKVYGSPTNKIENTAKVIQEIGPHKKVCFFGDSRSDYEAAKNFELNFVFVSQFSEWSEGHSIPNTKIKNFLI